MRERDRSEQEHKPARHTKPETRLKNRLISAGFPVAEIFSAMTVVRAGKLGENSLHLLNSPFSNPVFLKSVSGYFESQDYENQRQNFLEAYLGKYLIEGCFYRPTEEDLVRLTKRGNASSSDFGTYMREIFDRDKKEYWALGNMFHFGLEVMLNPDLYSLFRSNVHDLIEFQNDNLYPDESHVLDLGRVACFLSHSENLDILLSKGDKFLFSELRSFNYLYSILHNRNMVETLDRYFAGERSWADRLIIFEPVLRMLGGILVKRADMENLLISDHIKELASGGSFTFDELSEEAEKLNPEEREGITSALVRKNMEKGDVPHLHDYLSSIDSRVGISQDLSAEKALKRIKCRENIWHPLVSLGIARTVGYEVEFPLNNVSMVQRLEGVVSDFGFKKGMGGAEYSETSPGPFYDPLTANVVFGKYVDAGIIDFYNYRPMTMHFNVGIKTGGMVSLVRGAYLTGYAINPSREFEKSELIIAVNSQDQGDSYTECKSFDVITRRGFESNMRALSYLSWALGAQQDVSRGSDSVSPAIKRKLAGIWHGYYLSLKEGLASIGITGYLKTPNNKSLAVQRVNEQLKYIFETPGARFGKLDKITRKTDKRIMPITLGERIWPNLASFARDITEKAVGQVETLADKVENEAVEEIGRIEKKSGEARLAAQKSFLRKYNYYETMDKDRLGVLDAYSRVKRLLLGA